MNKISGKQKVSFTGLLIAIGIVYGDIAVSYTHLTLPTKA